MGERVSFIRSKIEKLQVYTRDKQRLLDEVFNPDVRDPAVVYHSEKSIEGILFLLKEEPVPNAEAAIVGHWNFNPLIIDAENINVYYLQPLELKNLNNELSKIDITLLERNYEEKKMKVNKVYPDIWDKDQGYDGLAFLKDHFIAFKKFISDAASSEQVVIAIPT